MSNAAIKEPERPKMEVIYEGLFGPKIEKIIILLVLLLLLTEIMDQLENGNRNES